MNFFLQAQRDEFESREKTLENVVELAKKVQDHSLISEDDRKKIKNDMSSLDESFTALKLKLNEKLKRYV